MKRKIDSYIRIYYVLLSVYHNVVNLVCYISYVQDYIIYYINI